MRFCDQIFIQCTVSFQAWQDRESQALFDRVRQFSSDSRTARQDSTMHRQGRPLCSLVALFPQKEIKSGEMTMNICPNFAHSGFLAASKEKINLQFRILQLFKDRFASRQRSSGKWRMPRRAPSTKRNSERQCIHELMVVPVWVYVNFVLSFMVTCLAPSC